ncbi:MAG: response regulator [Anaerolineales bacterium]
MTQRHLLIVEDDADTANLLQMYFAGSGYDVQLVGRGPDALSAARHKLPDLILLDINLPGMNGLDVCAALRAAPRPAYVPVIFISERNTQADRIAGLSAGAHDFVSKPFDLEELRLRVQAAINRAERDHLTDPRTGLPTGRLVDEQIKRVKEQPGWHTLECQIDAFRSFVDLNGFAAGDDVLKFAAHLLREGVREAGSAEDFIGHPANDTFIVLTAAPDAAGLVRTLQSRFDEEVKAHYSFMDAEQGYIQIRASGGQMTQAPLMTLRVREK